MEYRDYYATLGIPRTASEADIKKAFRKAARTHHPDVNASDTGAERRFKEVNEAYDVLGDPEKRKLYDQLGANWEAYQRAGTGGPQPFDGAAAGGFPGGIRFEYRGDPDDLSGFSDFFRTFFAGGPAPGAAGSSGGRGRRGRSTARVSGAGLDDLFGGLGGFATDASRVHDPFGTGNGRGGGRRTGGQDVTAEVEASLEDVASGTTAIVQIGDRRLEVRIPAGIASGQRIRLSGKAGPDGGDVTLTVRVRPHAIFARSGADLTREIPVSLGEALLGAEIPVGTLDGRTLLLTIPPGTQNGRTFRLRGHGLPRFKAEGRGDLLVRTRVVLPAALDDEGRRLARALADHVRQPNPREGHHEPVGHA